MVVDASALIAILEDEDDVARYAEAIAAADARKVTALLQEAGCQVENVTARQAQLALDAYAIYGKGQKGKAGLNYGDCFSYALAKATGLPLLFKGNDFSRTDLPPALSRE